MKRIVELDFIKALAIMMVVIAHTSCPPLVGHMFYLIHVPLFFMVSGYTCKNDEHFCSKSSLKHFFVRRIKSLYVPFLKYVLPIVLLHNVFYKLGVYETHFTANEFIFQICRTLLMSLGTNEPLLGQLWFLKVLFLTEIYYAAIVFLTHQIGCSKYYILTILYILVFVLPLDNFLHLYMMNLFWPIKAMAYYNIGELLKINYPVSSLKKTILPFVLFVGLWVVSGSFISTSFQESIQFIALYQLLLTIFAFYALSSFPYASLPKWIQKKLQILGGRTMGGVCLHNLVFLVVSIIYLLLSKEDLSIIAENCCIMDVPWWCFSICGILVPYLFYTFKTKCCH